MTIYKKYRKVRIYIFKGVSYSTMVKYTAVIVEFRKHPAYDLVFENFFTHLSDEWGFMVVYGKQNNAYVNTIVDTIAEKYNQPSRIVKRVELNYDNMTLYDYSELLKHPDFYHMIDTETFLIFQTDSLLLKDNLHKLDRFLHYDYVGAPWTNNLVGNGGLSLTPTETPCPHKLGDNI